MREDATGKFGRGASIMVASVFIAKLLGLLIVVPLQNIIGGYAYGIYRIAYPLYTIMLTLSTIGFPLALSKTISQLSSAGKRFGPKLLFEDANWLITPDERTGLVGGNGTG